MRSTRWFVLALGLCAAACGGTGDAADAAPPPDAEPAPDAPKATGTLLAVGTLVVENPDNITEGNTLRVNVEVRVERDGQPVTDAIVIVNPAPPAFQVVLTGEALDPSHYVGNYFGYFDTAKITIETPTDQVLETLLRGPMLYQIEQPLRDQAVPGAADLHISWSKPEGSVDLADLAMALSGFTAPDLADPGVYDVPAAELVVGEEELSITRWRQNPLPSAAAGSEIRFGVTAYQPFIVQ